ncbi:uncharacterized protein LOC131224194 [Magnolia sinica]|uniref:uncharacterized protein LOC131224194 n=1 Tax=Magnolia sinica TaxID=86752 RepID=UPI002658BC20|nr:uncharacterized protein LOC131224194 [Magnolia sinica]
MPLLRVLDLSHSFMFKELPAGIGNLAELRYLNLSHTDIVSLPEEMRNLVKLQHLNLQHSFLQELPAGIGSLVELRYLNPSATRIRSLPEEMRNLVKLQHLNLWHSFLQELPVGFGNLAELRYLNLSGTGITSLPEEMKNLVNMQHLEFQSSCLQELPAGIGDLAELQYLNLSNTWIRSLPEEIGNLVKLKHLDLRTVFLDRIPQGAISRLSELRVMKLYNSMWEEGSEGFNISELESLEHLIHLDLTTSTVHDLERLLGSSKLLKVTRFLQLEGCEGLTTSIRLSYLFTEIRRISIEKCNMLEEVTIGADGETYDDYPVSSLEYLHLRNNSGLKCILVGCGCFENLSSISIEHCYKLKKIDSLLQLESLEKIEISNCYELEEVISKIADDDDDDEEVGDKGLMQLSFISLKNVPKLTSIWSDALHFPSLEVMEVSACPKLKKLPLSLHSAHNSLREIRGGKECMMTSKGFDDIEACLMLSNYRAELHRIAAIRAGPNKKDLDLAYHIEHLHMAKQKIREEKLKLEDRCSATATYGRADTSDIHIHKGSKGKLRNSKHGLSSRPNLQMEEGS